LRAAVLGLALLAGVGRAAAEDALPLKALADLKAATVFLKVEAGREEARGTGFVIRADGATAYIVTNHHVLDLRPEGARRGPVGAGPAVTAVFNSGAPGEQSVRAAVLASDPRADLAVLRADGVKAPPPAIGLTERPELVETMAVYVFGFPLGELLAAGDGNPAITVGKGTVSSIRRNGRGELATVQIDGDVTPGNSGGPVVDARGRLVGVAAATVRGRRIGFAIPAGELTDRLQGRLIDHQFATRPGPGGGQEVRVELGLFDPFGRLRGATFYYLPGAAPAAKKLAGLPGVQKVVLRRGPGQLAGTFTLGPGDGSVCFQAVYVDGEGKTFLSNPRVRRLR
jgi:S1-C subfamily serine protease